MFSNTHSVKVSAFPSPILKDPQMICVFAPHFVPSQLPEQKQVLSTGPRGADWETVMGWLHAHPMKTARRNAKVYATCSGSVLTALPLSNSQQCYLQRKKYMYITCYTESCCALVHVTLWGGGTPWGTFWTRSHSTRGQTSYTKIQTHWFSKTACLWTVEGSPEKCVHSWGSIQTPNLRCMSLQCCYSKLLSNTHQISTALKCVRTKENGWTSILHFISSDS